MDANRWNQIQEVLLAAHECAAEERESLIDARCGSDLELKQQIRSLLAASEAASSFFDGLVSRAVGARGDFAMEDPFPPGTLIGPYRVRERIGGGGMGTVYRATDERLRRDVALKVPARHLLDDPAEVARFRREAQVLAALNHPCIAVIHDMEEAEGWVVLVLELLEGPTLEERMRAGGLLPAEAVDIASQIASALGAAHGAGIIHRDLKPANIKVTAQGQVTVLDFGIAQWLEPTLSTAAHTPVPRNPDREERGRGLVLGTVPYMSPERLDGSEAEPGCDIWALGVILFEMLAGCHPFRAATPLKTMARISEQDPDWGLLPTELPHEVSVVIRGCLQRNVSRRLGDAGAVREALLRAARATSEKVADPPTSPSDSAPPDRSQGAALQQVIRFCTSSDAVRIAYATVGKGATIVKAANWLNHLEYDWESPVWRHLLHALAGEWHLIRYDERGTGLSDRHVEDISLRAFVLDLEAVVEAAAPERFALLGVSQGCSVSIAYAVEHPDRVSHLILFGGYARGAALREGDSEAVDALATVLRHGWGKDNPACRQIFTSRMIPGATREQMDWFNDLQRLTASPETAYRLRRTFDRIDVRALLPRIRVPTLVMHVRNEAAVPLEEGRLLAREIPGARFCALEGSNHLILEDDPAWPRFLQEVRRFLSD